jgi:hypothetical protein
LEATVFFVFVREVAVLTADVVPPVLDALGVRGHDRGLRGLHCDRHCCDL